MLGYPPGRETPLAVRPPCQGDPPPETSPGYGQWAAGTHPTGMHSCCNFCHFLQFLTIFLFFAYCSRYRSGTVNLNTVNSKFHLIRSYCEIFFYNFPNIPCLKCTVNSNFHLIRSKTLPTNDFELTVRDLYWKIHENFKTRAPKHSHRRWQKRKRYVWTDLYVSGVLHVSFKSR